MCVGGIGGGHIRRFRLAYALSIGHGDRWMMPTDHVQQLERPPTRVLKSDARIVQHLMRKLVGRHRRTAGRPERLTFIWQAVLSPDSDDTPHI
jgi:hypothetical protein